MKKDVNQFWDVKHHVGEIYPHVGIKGTGVIIFVAQKLHGQERDQKKGCRNQIQDHQNRFSFVLF